MIIVYSNELFFSPPVAFQIIYEACLVSRIEMFLEIILYKQKTKQKGNIITLENNILELAIQYTAVQEYKSPGAANIQKHIEHYNVLRSSVHNTSENMTSPSHAFLCSDVAITYKQKIIANSTGYTLPQPQNVTCTDIN